MRFDSINRGDETFIESIVWLLGLIFTVLFTNFLLHFAHMFPINLNYK